MTPAQVVKHELGVRPLAKQLGCTPSCIAKWGDKVPQNWHQQILEIADGKVTAQDLIYGRPDSE